LIVYNVTVKIDCDVHDEWLVWMKKKHILDVMASGVFTKYQMSRLIGINEQDGITYSIQYTLENVANLNKYFEEYAPDLQEEHLIKFKDKFVAYRTVMEVVSTS
jgi:hypothetical protein